MTPTRLPVIVDPENQANLDQLVTAVQAVADAEGSTAEGVLQHLLAGMCSTPLTSGTSSPPAHEPSQEEIRMDKLFCEKCHVIMNMTALIREQCPLCLQKTHQADKKETLKNPRVGKEPKLILEADENEGGSTTTRSRTGWSVTGSTPTRRLLGYWHTMCSTASGPWRTEPG
jgi:hypothetical protein